MGDTESAPGVSATQVAAIIAASVSPTTPVASEAAMLALPDFPGQRAIRTDLTPDQIYIQTTSPATNIANWQLTTADVASEVAFVPDGDIAATNTQAAVVEVRDDAASALGTHAALAASETVSAHAEIATQAETNAGADDARIVTPLKLATRIAALRYQIPITFGRNETAPFPATFILNGGKYWELVNGATRSVRGSGFVQAEANLAVDPVLTFKFIVSAVGAGDADVRFQVTAKYVATLADAGGGVNQTFTFSSPVTNVLNQAHEASLTLSGAAVDLLGTIQFTVSRLGADAADTFTGDIAINESAQVLRA